MIFIYAYVFMCVHTSARFTEKSRESQTNPLELELQVGGRCPMWEMGTESGSLAREVTALNHLATSPVLVVKLKIWKGMTETLIGSYNLLFKLLIAQVDKWNQRRNKYVIDGKVSMHRHMVTCDERQASIGVKLEIWHIGLPNDRSGINWSRSQDKLSEYVNKEIISTKKIKGELHGPCSLTPVYFLPGNAFVITTEVSRKILWKAWINAEACLILVHKDLIFTWLIWLQPQWDDGIPKPTGSFISNITKLIQKMFQEQTGKIEKTTGDRATVSHVLKVTCWKPPTSTEQRWEQGGRDLLLWYLCVTGQGQSVKEALCSNANDPKCIMF